MPLFAVFFHPRFFARFVILFGLFPLVFPAIGSPLPRSAPILSSSQDGQVFEIGYGSISGLQIGQRFPIFPADYVSSTGLAPLGEGEVIALSENRAKLKVKKFCAANISVEVGLELAMEPLKRELPCVQKSAEKLSDSDSHFEIGYFALLNRDYPLCASQFLLSLDSEGQIFHRSHLYLAACQLMLGYKGYAAGNLSQVDEDSLEKKDAKLYQFLRSRLVADITRYERVYPGVSVYSGFLKYSQNYSKMNGSVMGALANASWKKWSLGAGVEKTSIHFRLTSNDYTQRQLHLDIGRWIDQEWRLKAGITYIRASTNSVNGTVYGAGAGYTVDEKTNLALDVYYSSYPYSSLGQARAVQVNASMNKKLIDGVKGGLWGNLLLQGIFPSAEIKRNPLVNYELRSSYFRVAAQMLADLNPVFLGVNGWIGRETLGVRNDGYVVYNALEDHVRGIGSSVEYAFSKKVSLKLAASNEISKVVTAVISSSVYSGMLNFNF